MGKLSTFQNVWNFAIMIGVCVPPIYLVMALQQNCDFKAVAGKLDRQTQSTTEYTCSLYLDHPIIFVNLMYFVFVDIGFWLIYVAQQSTWLIDPHWQLIPYCIMLFYFTHPTAVHSLRAIVTLLLLSLWALRLMYNYVRREEWQFGEREDWRYADMRERFGPKLWCFISFFAVSVAQHPMLVGMTLPLCATMLGPSAPVGPLDFLACILCVSGIAIANIADDQLFAYMGQGASKPLLFDSGLWHYSRHPNHFGEQTWWVGLALFGVAATGGAGWPFLGVLYNHPIDTFATLPLIEERMLKRPERRELYKAYQERTSLIVPWPVKSKTSNQSYQAMK